MLFKLELAFESVNAILTIDHSNIEDYVLSFNAVCYAVGI